MRLTFTHYNVHISRVKSFLQRIYNFIFTKNTTPQSELSIEFYEEAPLKFLILDSKHFTITLIIS